MRIVAISDTHGKHRKMDPLPEGDVLIHAGDFMGDDRYPMLVDEFPKWLGRHAFRLDDFAQWFRSQPHKHKVCIAGNHDVLFSMMPTDARRILGEGITYLQDTYHVIDGVTFYGSPYTPALNGWAFNRARGREMQEVWDRIPYETNVLITHGPPRGVRDQVANSLLPLGCDELRKAILRVRPKLHIFGHIHSGHGSEKLGRTTCLNASILNEEDEITFGPISHTLEISHGSN